MLPVAAPAAADAAAAAAAAVVEKRTVGRRIVWTTRTNRAIFPSSVDAAMAVFSYEPAAKIGVVVVVAIRRFLRRPLRPAC